jgi:CO/xanthine dehydrogenase FAD-binding subunit
VGGNLGTASPAGDALPVLAAYEAQVSLISQRGRRELPWQQFLTGPKKTAIAPDELILETSWPVFRAAGSFSKIGTRNAMVISVAGLALVIDEDARAIRVALGSVGPTILRATDAEAFIGRVMAETGAWSDRNAAIEPPAIQEFSRMVAAAARPIDDVRGTSAYRRHALRVLAERALRWALDERRTAAWW